MFDLDSTELQYIDGYFPDFSGKPYKAELFFNRHQFWESELIFRETLEINSNHQEFIFRTDFGELVLNFLHLNIGANTQYKFSIKELTIYEVNDDAYFSTGLITNLSYFPKKFEINHVKVKLKDFSTGEFPTRQRGHIIELRNIDIKNEVEIQKYLSALSLLACSLCSINEIRYFDRTVFKSYYTKSNQILYFGSGIKFYPIKLNVLGNLLNDINENEFINFGFLYASFCTEKGVSSRLVKGCSILDYIMDLFISSNFIRKGINTSETLFNLLNKLNLSSVTWNYIEHIIIGFKKDSYRKEIFEFFEVRNRYIHRGEVLLTGEQIQQLNRSIIAVNEIIRIVIPHIGLITNWEFKQKKYLPIQTDIAQIVKYRQENIKWEF